MPAELTVHFADRPRRTLLLEQDGRYEVGRDEGCDLVIDDERVSRRHARLVGSADAWSIEDLGSKNGTSVDGRPADGRRSLPGACWLSVGGVAVRFEHLDREALRRRRRGSDERWRATLALDRRLDPGRGLDGLLDRLLDSVLRVSGAERGFVLLTDGDGELQVAATAGLETADLARGSFRGSVGAVERCLSGGRSVVTCDALADADLGGRPSVAAGGIRSLVCLPLQVLGRSIGAVYADSTAAGSGFSELDVEILEALATHAALAIAVVRLAGEAEGLAAELPTVGAGRGAASPDRRRPLGTTSRTSWSALVAAHAVADGAGPDARA